MSKPNFTPAQIAALKRKVIWRIIPFVFVLYIIAYLDRANVGFAKLAMQNDLKFSEGIFALGAGIFFIGYLLLEIPGALMVERGGARKWFSRILVSWGICTCLVGVINTPMQFYVARFLLGVAEAGFFPGLIVYFSHWFPTKDRSKALALLVTAIPVSQLIGAPLSGWIIDKVGWLDLPGWRWVFILQGLPAVVFGVITFFIFADNPKSARWLTPDERDWLMADLEEDKARHALKEKISIWDALRHPNVLLLALALFLANCGSYAFGFWLPTTIKGNTGMSAASANYWTALPYLGSLIVVVLAGLLSDRTGKRKLVTAGGMALSGVFLILGTIPDQSFGLKMMWLCLTAASIYAWPPSFWVLPSLTLTASAAAAAIGLINSVGNLGGFCGPYMFGALRDLKWTPEACLRILGASYLLAAILALLVKVRSEKPHTSDPTI